MQQSLVFMMQMTPTVSHGLIIMDCLFLRSSMLSFLSMLGYCMFSDVECNVA